MNFHITGASEVDLEETVGLAVKIWDMNLDDCVKVSKARCLCTLAVGFSEACCRRAGRRRRRLGGLKE